jgi:MFS transporter, SP family, xylose:H+ symportor
MIKPTNMLSYPVRIALIAALGGFLFGFETAVISGAEKTIQSLWSLSPVWQGLTVASSLIGTVIGSMIAGIPAQKFGRKKVLMFVAILYLLSAIGCASSSIWILFISFRFIGGIAVGASSVVGPMYIAEISPARLRGRLVGSFQLNIVIGIFLAYLSNYFLLISIGSDSWRWMLGIMAIPAALFYILVRQIPESPRWLVLNNRDEEAKQILTKIGEPNVNAEIAEIHSLAHEGTKESLFSKKFRKPIAFAVLLAMFNQLAGINALIYYAPRIFEAAGISKDSAFLQAVSIGATNLLFTIIAMRLIDRFGRKTLLLVGSVGMIVFLALAAFSFGSSNAGGYSLMFYLIGFIAFFAFSQGAVIWVFISEIFPNSVRSKGQSLGSTTHWIMAAAISWTFPIVAEMRDGSKIAFLFFSAMMLIHFLFVWRWLPETKGRSLETIQKELGIT